MKFRSLRKWDNPQESKELIYFAQMLEELLFDFSLDSYKAPAMNSSLLAKEALAIHNDVIKGTVNKENIKFVCAELCKSISADDVAKKMLTLDVSGINSILMESSKQKSEKLKNTLQLLDRQLYLPAYKEQLDDELSIAVKEGKSTSTIRQLTRGYVTTLINLGFSSNHIREESNRFFFHSSDRISDNNAIDDFLELFTISYSEFAVLYKVPVYLREFSENTEKFLRGMEISDEAGNDFSNFLHHFTFDLDSQHTYLLLKDVPALDRYSAKFSADNYVNLFQSLVSLYHHKEKPREPLQSLVIDKEKQCAKKIVKTVHPMHKGNDNRAAKASEKFKKLLSGHKLEKDSFNKFNRSVELHGLALSSHSVENQMINLWIALESLVPSDSQSGSQIEQVIYFLIPFLNLKYIPSLLERLYNDLKIWNRSLHSQVFRGLCGEAKAIDMAIFLTSEDFLVERERLEGNFRDFHLLSDRYEHLKGMLSSPKRLHKIIDTHTERVEWQLRRIYRARNSIVHDGNTPSYAEILIENLHDYLDTLLDSLISMLEARNLPKTLGEASLLARMNYDSYMKNLNKDSASFTVTSINNLLFSRTLL